MVFIIFLIFLITIFYLFSAVAAVRDVAACDTSHRLRWEFSYKAKGNGSGGVLSVSVFQSESEPRVAAVVLCVFSFWRGLSVCENFLL